MVKTESGVMIENDSILEKSGIVLNNSRSALSQSDIEFSNSNYQT